MWRVSLGNNRNNGRNLGAFTVNANNGLTNANGNNWRTRPLLILRQSALGLNLKHHTKRLTYALSISR